MQLQSRFHLILQSLTKTVDNIDRVKKIYGNYPHISLPQHLVADEDAMQKFSQSVIEAKIRVEGCSSFLKAAIK